MPASARDSDSEIILHEDVGMEIPFSMHWAAPPSRVATPPNHGHRRAAAKSLVREGLRCACHFFYTWECPTQVFPPGVWRACGRDPYVSWVAAGPHFDFHELVRKPQAFVLEAPSLLLLGTTVHGNSWLLAVHCAPTLFRWLCGQRVASRHQSGYAPLFGQHGCSCHGLCAIHALRIAGPVSAFL